MGPTHVLRVTKRLLFKSVNLSRRQQSRALHRKITTLRTAIPRDLTRLFRVER